jgi:NAD-dependent DNA ligase
MGLNEMDFEVKGPAKALATAAGAIVRVKLTDKTDIIVEGLFADTARRVAAGESVPFTLSPHLKKAVRELTEIRAAHARGVVSWKEAHFIEVARGLAVAPPPAEEEPPKKVARTENASRAADGSRPPKNSAGKTRGSADSVSGETLVFTGTLGVKRTVAEGRARAAGATVTGSVSKNTTILVAGAGAGSKAATANGLGVTVITEEEFDARCP